MRSVGVSFCPLALLVFLQVAWGQGSISPDASTPTQYGVSPVFKDLLDEATDVFQTMQAFMTTLSQFDRIRLHEGKRENDIRRYGVKRNDAGFQITGWRKKRSTMEADFISTMFTGKLDHQAKETLKSIYKFVDGMEKARAYYENGGASLDLPASYQTESSDRSRDVV
ncbi:uncharacterized protein [Apostichopus japonicus]|uniref:uncharacterized protein n=1 Tax=Stichopus japonicus TaxID=307972 RepID=UPI003AB552CC